MRKVLASAAVGAALIGAPVWAADEFVFDPSHTHILFSIDHLGFSDVHGEFLDFEGSAVFDPDAPENSSVSVTIDTASIDTGWAARDEHLRNADFFDVGTHPTMTFESTSIEMTGDDTAVVTGDLTILGTTQEVTLDVTMNGMGPHPFQEGVTVAGFSATGSIDRTAFGLAYGSPAIGDEVHIQIETELNAGGS